MKPHPNPPWKSLKKYPLSWRFRRARTGLGITIDFVQNKSHPDKSGWLQSLIL